MRLNEDLSLCLCRTFRSPWPNASDVRIRPHKACKDVLAS